MSRLIVFLALGLCACGDDSSGACMAPRPQRIRISIEGASPSYAAIRTSNDVWEELPVSLHSDICVSYDYTLLWSCDNARSFAAGRTPADGDVRMGCGSDVEQVDVTGEMAQPGVVQIGGGAESGTTRPWSYSLMVPKGTHDVVASDAFPWVADASNRVLIRRALTLTADTVIPDIDLTSGIALEPATLDVDGSSPTDLVEAAVRLRDSSGRIAEISGSPGPIVMLLPAAEVREDERQTVFVTAQTPFVDGQSFFRSIEAGGSTLTLPPRLTLVGLEVGQQSRASWESLPADYYEIALQEFGAPAYRSFEATRSWVEATGASSLQFDTSAPGYQDSFPEATRAHFTVRVRQSELAAGVTALIQAR